MSFEVPAKLPQTGGVSFRASEARPGIQDFQRILDSGFRRNDKISDSRGSLIYLMIFFLPYAIDNFGDEVNKKMPMKSQ